MAKGIKNKMKKINEKGDRVGGLKGLLSQFSSTFKRATAFSAASYSILKRKAFRIAWVGTTSCILVFLPILIEVAREKTLIEQEKIIVADLKKQGYHDQELSRMGFATDIEPSVGLANGVPTTA
mmetsp:Transcript_46592/g.63434  ORF Transcript_46592/g.63434 Transcript_46592/m.63434 type:complete len:124 (-) Transcript_46592:623-994(-)